MPDEVIDRFCLLGPVATQVERLEELRALGVDQFALYLQHDAKAETLAAYGDKVMPAVNVRKAARREPRRRPAPRPRLPAAGGPLMHVLRYARKTVLAVLGLAVIVGLWELYKALGPPRGGSLFGAPLLPRAGDAAMPHVTSVIEAFGAQEVGGATIVRGAAAPTVFESVLSAAGNSLLWAGVGFAIGVVVGLALALLMDRLAVLERALLPWIVLSQTVPLIALAPLVTGWGQGLHLGPLEWQRWMSVSLIAGYLAFFPVAVGMARGLKSPDAVAGEYFRSVNAGWRQTLTRLKLPASVPFLIPALRLAAAGAVVGTVVGEISIGLEGGIGRLIISYSQGATGDPSRVYTAVLGAAALGLVTAAVVTLFDLALRRYQRTDTA